MNDKETVRTSKFLSLILRHEPERVGLKLGEAGWVGVEDLLQAVNRHDVPLTLDQLKHIVATSDKKRFAISEDGRRIRASRPTRGPGRRWSLFPPGVRRRGT